MQTLFNGSTVKIILNVEVDISEATTKRINFLKSDGTSGYWNADQETTTSISYTTSVSDLDVNGIWKLQAYIVTPTWTNYGQIDEMIVKPTL